MSRLRIGIIGCGGIANGKHLPSLKAINRADIVAFCDLIPERAEKAAREYGTPDAKVYTDYHELLKDESSEAKEVWRRAFASKGEMRTSRCTPFSERRKP